MSYNDETWHSYTLPEEDAKIHRVFKYFLNKHGYNFDDVNKIGFSRFQNKGYDVIMSMTSPTKFYHVTQIILLIWSCDQSLVTVAFL